MAVELRRVTLQDVGQLSSAVSRKGDTKLKNTPSPQGSEGYAGWRVECPPAGRQHYFLHVIAEQLSKSAGR